MKDYIVEIYADGGWGSDTIRVRAASEREALSEIVFELSGKWVEFIDVNGDLNRLRTDKVIKLTVTEEDIQ